PELRQPPGRERRLRVIALTLREDHVVRILLDAAVAVVVLALQPLEDDVGRTRNDLRRAGAVLHLVEMLAGEMQRLERGLDRPRITRGEVLVEGAHLF